MPFSLSSIDATQRAPNCAMRWLLVWTCVLCAVPVQGAEPAGSSSDAPTGRTAAAPDTAAPRSGHARRIIYNSDGCSIFIYRKGVYKPVAMTIDDVKNVVAELMQPGSQVDTFLLCVNAQVTFYPSKVGTLIGSRHSGGQRKNWPAAHRQWIATLEKFYAQGVDPYAVLLAEAKQRGRESMLTIRMNDAHAGGEDSMLRAQFWVDHPEYRLRKYGLDFSHREVREYMLAIIREATARYDCDGLEMDFNRFAFYFPPDAQVDKVALINELVHDAKAWMDELGRKRNKRLVLAARVPTSYDDCLAMGCDPVAWASRGWIDFLTVSEDLLVRYDLPLRPWKERIKSIPIYGSIESTAGNDISQYLTAPDYRRAARHLWADGADGIYLFNFIMSRENGPGSREPPFEVLSQLGDPKLLKRLDVSR